MPEQGAIPVNRTMQPTGTSAVCSLLNNVYWEPLPSGFVPSVNETILLLASILDYSDEQYHAFGRLISPEEYERAVAFHSVRSKKQFILGHYLLRHILAPLAGSSPGNLRFGTAEFHKPILTNNPVPVHFNLSHAGDLVMIGYNLSQDVGIDIEKMDQTFDYADFAAVHYSPGERKMLVNESIPAFRQFYLVWTRKEAWLKLTGEGLRDDLYLMDVSSEIPSGIHTKNIYITSSFYEEYVFSLASNLKTPVRFFKPDKQY